MSNLYVGTQKPSEIYVGTSKAKSVYLGTEKIWTPVLAEPTYVSFLSDTASFEIYVRKNWQGHMWYSHDTITWTEITDNGYVQSSQTAPYALYMRGIGNNCLRNSGGYRWSMLGGPISMYGNLENMLDYEVVASGNHPYMADYCFSSIFYSNEALVRPASCKAINFTYGSMGVLYSWSGIDRVLKFEPNSMAYYYSWPDAYRGCSNIKLSETQTAECPYAWEIPENFETGFMRGAFYGTSGTYTGDIIPGHTYYVNNEPI